MATASEEATLTVVIKGARKLKSTQTLGLQDPYLRAWITGSKSKNKVRTKTYVDGGSMAVWNESNEFRVLDRQLDCLFLEVKNENDFTSDATIGRLKLPCVDISENPVEDWYGIFGDQGDRAGEVHLTLSMKEAHKTKTAEATRVTSGDVSAAAGADDCSRGGELPHSWVQHSTSSGCPYFVNQDLNITTWIDPRSKAFPRV